MKRDRDLELNRGGASRGQEVEGGVEGNRVGVHVVSRRHSWAAPDREERIASPSQTQVSANLACYVSYQSP